MLNSTVTTTSIEYNHFGFVKRAMHEDFFVISFDGSQFYRWFTFEVLCGNYGKEKT